MKNIGRMICEGHLGGFIEGGDPRTYCPNVWDHFIHAEGVPSMVDVGCGIGVACEHFAAAGVHVTGIDGSGTAQAMFRVPGRFVLHDFTSGEIYKPGWLAWSCEFVEHVESRYLPHVMSAFRYCSMVAMTYAAPGQDGHHHVNCQPADYWIGAFAAIGFAFDEPTTLRLRTLDPDTHFAERGMVFRRCN
jgi:hypothetical protein